MSSTTGKPFEHKVTTYDEVGAQTYEVAMIHWRYSHTVDIMKVWAVFKDGRIEDLFHGGPETTSAVLRALNDEHGA